MAFIVMEPIVIIIMVVKVHMFKEDIIIINIGDLQ